MRKLLAIVAALALSAGTAFAVCSAGNTACGSTCNTACGSGNGGTFYGTCVAAPLGASTQCTGSTPTGAPGNITVLVRCSGGAPVCASGPFGNSCKSDGDCASGQACVSGLGVEGCGTGFAVCMTTCTSNS